MRVSSLWLCQSRRIHCIMTRPKKKKRKQTCSSGNSFADAPDAAGDDDAGGAVECVVHADDLTFLAKLVNCLD